jgi:hypothetical protein
MELNWERKSGDPLIAGYLHLSGGQEEGEEE